MSESADITELRREIKRLRSQIKKQRYGLVWLDVPEAFEAEAIDKLPILREIAELEIPNNGNVRSNILIEGDNFHSLTCLNYTHKGKIDVIYIDPPYNTGDDGFRYKDRRVLEQFPDGDLVPKSHPLRHSYWLSFMEKRLRLAKSLLARDGFIFISIDDYEFAQLKMLCDEIFGGSDGERSLGTLIWQRAKGGGNNKKFVRGHEYVLAYSMGGQFRLTQAGDKAAEHLRKSELPKSADKYVVKDGELYFVNDDFIRRVFGKYESGTERRCEYENLVEFKGEQVKEEVDKKLASGEYVLRKQPSGLHYVCRLEQVADMRKVMYSIIQGFLSEVGKNDLEALGMGDDFDNPKPVGFIKVLLDATAKTSGTFLDFFAGSGTTGQAVMELNQEDGGDRQVILCTNNENEIAIEVTRKRLQRVSEGIGDYQAIPNGLKYYRTGFVGSNDVLSVTDDDRIDLALNAGELLALAENTLRHLESNEFFSIYEDEIADRITGIYFREELDQFAEFVDRIDSRQGSASVYIFTWGNDISYESDFSNTNVTVKPIPQPIMEIYRRIHRMEAQLDD